MLRVQRCLISDVRCYKAAIMHLVSEVETTVTSSPFQVHQPVNNWLDSSNLFFNFGVIFLHLSNYTAPAQVF